MLSVLTTGIGEDGGHFSRADILASHTGTGEADAHLTYDSIWQDRVRLIVAGALDR